jgi:hypothetical protein
MVIMILHCLAGRRFLFSIVMGSLAVVLALPGYAKGPGTTAVEFLKEGVGARETAMGGAGSALTRDASALFGNPAALALLKVRSVTLLHSGDSQSTVYDHGAYAQGVGRWWGVGAGVQRLSAGSLDRVDETGSQTGSFTPADTAFVLGVARRAGPLSVGLSVKGVQSKILDTASTVAGSVGVIWPGLGGGKLSLALAIEDVGEEFSYALESAKLPTAYRAGVGVSLSKAWVAGLDAVVPQGGDTARVAVGTEYGVVKNDRFSLAARAGYNTRSAGEADGLTGASLGLGVGVKGVVVDYAFLPLGDLGVNNRVSVSFAF